MLVPDGMNERFVFAGVPGARTLQSRVWCALQEAIDEYLIAERKYNDAGDKRPCLFDASGENFSDAWGHPPPSHKYGDTIDIGYFTTGETNRTQSYGGWRPLWDEYKLADMKLFNPQRTVRFLLTLQRKFPMLRWMTYADVYNRMLPHLTRELDSASNVDRIESYNHDTHCHIYLFGFEAFGKYKDGMIT